MLASRATFAIQDATIMTKDPRWLTRAEAAALIGVDVVTVWRWSAKGKLPQPIKLSERCTVWRAEEVRAWMNAQGKAA